jgi:SWI/SNF-related matrix-associated actin-dependent regulator of chromatin subfamily A member 5
MKSRDGKEIRTVLYYVFVDVLLICLLVVWSRCPTLRGIRFHGDKAEREELKATVLNPSTRAEDRDWDVCVTTYEIFNLEVNAFRRMAWRYLIIDEAHRLKNEDSQFSTNIRVLNTEHRLLLTGTPLQNNLHELWALLNFLLPDVFSSSEEFDEWFNLDVDDTEAKQRMISQLHKILRPFMLRRLKADVEKSLLPKTETILFTGLSVMQKNLYRQILLRDIDQINGSMAAAGNGSNSQGGRTAILNIVMQLRKCCNHPYLFPGIEDRTLNPYGDHLFNNCGKMNLLDKLLKKLKERGNRVLIFSQMTRMLDILEDYFALREYSYCRIDGNTTYDDREDRIAAYNAPGSEIFIFLLSTRAGGLGINLQTADTVIIYDSDWNPQADLQAQDRCHRIGQKKQVHVYRLVTDDTVEVKVVERAQQKLKLDAMVVQQGRLAEKEKKMTKNDLLDTLRFGADSIFRTKDSSSITDADIENILLDGEKRTKEMSAQFETADKGDMYDFSFDGSIGTQKFEGVDYSDKATRGGQAGNQGDGFASFGFIETGPRERKAIINYSDGTSMRTQTGGTNDKKQPKIPRHLRLPKMEDWQFFERDRLQELQDEEIELFDKLAEKDELPSSAELSKLVLLDSEKQTEKQALLAEGFGDWNRYHYTSFVKASGKYGRNEFEKISEDVGHTPEEVERYAKAFWSKAQDFLSSTDYERHIKTIEKGEKRLEDIDRLTRATSRLVAMFRDPWEELTFRHIGNQGRLFNAIEDRYLLCLTHLHGYGNWDRVRSSVRKCERFRFNYYLLSCSAEALGKRCEALMRAAEREMTEIDKKQQAVDSAHSALNAATAAPTAPAPLNTSKFASLTSIVQNGTADDENKNSNNEQSGANGVESTQTLMTETLEGNHGRLAELLKQIAEESRKLAATRAELQKAKRVTISSKSKHFVSDSGGASAAVAPQAEKDAGDNTDTRGERKGAEKKGVPESLIPELCRLLHSSGSDGVTKVQEKFISKYPNISKRQVELEAQKLAVKEKQGNDATKVWHIRPEFEHLLEVHDNESPEVEEQAKTPKSAKKKGSITDFMVSKSGSTTTPTATSGKRKQPGSSTTTTPADKQSPSTSTEKKKSSKPKTAFQLYVKEHRAEAEASLGDDASDTTALKNRLLEMWHALKSADRAPYEKLEAEEKAKFESRSGSSKKKAKR